MTLATLIEEARKLSFQEKVDLMDHLVCMIHGDPESAAVHARQMEDLDRRIAEYRSGKAELLPGDEAMERLRRREGNI
jgi:putative addiction module component (TIGR02574 family)